jgi:hypothetical protein
MSDTMTKVERQRANREAARKRGLPVGDPRHGKPVGYSYYGCKCFACSHTQSNGRKAWYYGGGQQRFPGVVVSNV